jgi:hypothetical protein
MSIEKIAIIAMSVQAVMGIRDVGKAEKCPRVNYLILPSYTSLLFRT